MKSKLKIIIPIIVAVIAIIIAALTINFTSDNNVNIGSLVEKAQNYLNENKYEQAIAEFEKAINIDPMNVDAYIGLAQAYIGIGDRDKAIETLEKGIEATGDQRLKNMLDNIRNVNNTTNSETSNSDNNADNIDESSQIEEVFFENKVEYVDGWYSVFRYNENKDITNMYLYNKNGKLRLEADYIYEIGSIKRTVYIDDQYYKEESVIFLDIMANIDAEHKRRANTTEKDPYNTRTYDENGNWLENHNKTSNEDFIGGMDDYYKNGILTQQHSYGDWTFANDGYDINWYYDERGYEIREEGIRGDQNYKVTYTYQNDEYGYPIIQYANGEKNKEYYNFYKNGKFKFGVDQLKNDLNNNHWTLPNYIDGPYTIEIDDDGKYLRELSHSVNEYDNSLSMEDKKYSFAIYYVPSYDGSKIIDSIICQKNVTLFECPYCNE